MTHSKFLSFACLLLALWAVAGCLGPKRAPNPARTYVLSPLPIEGTGTFDSGRDLGLGIAPIEIPAYLLDGRIVLRKGGAEVRYFENHRWAERLDKGVQRVIGANLSLLLESDRVVLSAWRRQTVQAELYLSVQRFECDDQGKVVLEARWHIATPGGDKALLTRHSRITRQTPTAPRTIEQAVTELSHALADLSREIAALVPSALANSRDTGSRTAP